MQQKKDVMNNTKTERFVMKKFQNVESRVNSPATAKMHGGIPRAPATG